MSFRVRPDGVIETDTAEEALQVSKALARKPARRMSRLEAGARPAPGAPVESARALDVTPPRLGPLEADLLRDFIKEATITQAVILEELSTNPSVTIGSLREATGLEKNQAVTGTLLGIRKQLLKIGIQHGDVYMRSRGSPERGDDSRYEAGPLLRMVHEADARQKGTLRSVSEK